MMKRFGHFLRRVQAAWLERKFAMLDREIKWNADRYQEYSRALRGARCQTLAKLHKMRQRDGVSPFVIVCAGQERFPIAR